MARSKKRLGIKLRRRVSSGYSRRWVAWFLQQDKFGKGAPNSVLSTNGDFIMTTSRSYEVGT